MSTFRQVVTGVLAALLTSGIVLGGFFLALSEQGQPGSEQPVAGVISSPTAENTPAPPSPTPVVVQTSLPEPTLPSTPTIVTTPSPISCPPPAGWNPVAVNPGDTLTGLAAMYATSVQALAEGNCLITQNLPSGSLLYVPPPATPTPPESSPSPIPANPAQPSATPCRPPHNWTRYTVQRGDTLYRISQLFRTTVYQLRAANCMGSSSFIQAGQILWVPNVPMSTSVPLPTAVPTVPPLPTDLPPTDTPTQPPPTEPPPTELPPTETPVSTPLPEPTDTPVPTPDIPPTATPEPTLTPPPEEPTPTP
jgi:LysM repeat protein